MKLGLGIYAGMATDDNLQFARQLGVTRIVQHLPGAETFPSATSGVWSYEDLKALVDLIDRNGLKLEAIENFDPAHWSDILLDGPRKEAQMANLQQTIRNMGRAGIPTMGYYFSLAGVWGRVHGPYARGGAESVGYIEAEAPEQKPIPKGEVWGRRYDPDAPDGDIGEVTHEQMWSRIEYFLENLVPVAEEAGVRLAAHPDDPPLPVLRGTARLITHPDFYDRLLSIKPSHYNAIEFCQGTVSEMVGSDVYGAIRKYAGQNIAYVHFRNVVGKVPNYREVFIDEGDVDMYDALTAYKEVGYDGVLIPDHTPRTKCSAPWHAGMAYALGYIKATMRALDIDIEV
ncbi:MAG: mannonate dehydratase [Candidatus Poribacteria bacterium]|nr:mannonate dehydratase [Candidatus Poribacteria bacterium]